ncbi:MAG TPA: CHAD domain-containing protein [Steroidobacteraceae bacterium]|nr:CHAD domain-containing protein [Steroidobacteraceae bacterium]
MLRDLAAELSHTDHRQLTPADVHITRKRIKRARAALALLRPALDEQDFDACDRSLRDAGRSLATARDATVIARTYARMRARTATASPHPEPGTVRTRTADGSPQGQTVSATVAHRHLVAAVRRLGRAPLTARGWAPLGSGVRAVYRRGRRRRPRESHPTTEALHAWRRHAKRYWHVLELFEGVNPQRIAPAVADARRLSDLLGEEHDLALLAERLHGRRRGVDEAVLATVADRRARLTRRALKLGAKVYDEPARVVERCLRADWERWRGQ